MPDLLNFTKDAITSGSSLKAPHFYKTSKNKEKWLEQHHNTYKMAS